MEPRITQELTKKEIYELFMLLQSMDEIKRSIVMVLCHLYPKEVSITEIADLAGYSKKSKYIFKSGALEMLEKEKILRIAKFPRAQAQIKLHEENELLIRFSGICQSEGKVVLERFLGKLLEYGTE